MEPEPRKSTNGPIIGGWACIGVGLILMFLSLMTFVLYGPLYLAAFILSIVGIAQGNTSKGIALLLCSARGRSDF